ncbi:uncharacterized protein LOC5577961 isoform X2 [Aedes aegypti]|uniref:Uncharacterized protein n=2 Tax=Aedes aegypti TaxID=7159 RepID=A0A1S4FZ34_AEDAE|nr:uncharacterized protein LOC5577961 isoform X2 [Aedes aegypti]
MPSSLLKSRLSFKNSISRLKMLKIVCLFAVLAVATADVRQVPSSAIPNRPGAMAVPIQHPRVLVPPMTGHENEKPEAPVSSDMQQSQDASGDMDKAETFGFGYHKHYYIAPRYYGAYYPYYGHHYGYPYYY